MSFNDFFRKITSLDRPMPWQETLAADAAFGHRLIRIPTGFGKTLGVLSAWLWHRIQRGDEAWPRRLVWCLPMRVLVEQTEQEVRNILQNAELLWMDGDHRGKVGVHSLMGGVDAGEWHLFPEECAVLIGTQDMLLSRAMNRGYAAARARWPMEFGLLNQDALWVMDEVQLMDVGLATSMQLQAFRDEDEAAGRSPRPCRTWWMSATLQSDWLRKSPDTETMAETVGSVAIPAEGRTGRLWDDVRKPCRRVEMDEDKALARFVAETYAEAEFAGIALVVVNRVDRAVNVYRALRADQGLERAGVEIRLIHSRFRPAERASWRKDFLRRDACGSGVRRIVVSTQVVEAGVDISAGLLVTDLAPWSSLVQRFGRCARWGGEAEVVVADFSPKDDKAAAPYAKDELDAAREALAHLSDVSPLRLEEFEEAHPERLPGLYPFDPPHLLLRHELDELFDTAPDLSGADIDISRFIRTGEERDARVFWADVPAKTEPDPKLRAGRAGLCAVPFLKARDWLCGKETKTNPKPRLRNAMRAWVWDWLNGEWKTAERRDLIPGRTVLVASDCGGYDPETGWDPDRREPVPLVPSPEPTRSEIADADPDNDALSVFAWQTIAVHGRETGNIARGIAETLIPERASLLGLCGRWHDLGKAHPAFQGSIVGENRPDRPDIAKAEPGAWLSRHRLYPMPGEKRRAGFRHELASALGLLEALRRANPDHPALLGPWRELLTAAGFDAPETADPPAEPSPLEAELLALSAEEFDLLAYLVCAHHGKIRLAWHATPADQAANDGTLRIAGVKEGDSVPPILLADGEGNFRETDGFAVDLSVAAAGLDARVGPGWTERALKLLETHGPFALAWMETMFRAADQRASRLEVRDELLHSEEAS